MAGHSKWAQIKHKKAVTDLKKGKVFSKLAKEISVSARRGGGDPAMNPRLRLSIDKAKEANMPHDNIRKAIMKGTGELPGASYDEAVYEGYGPGGVAILVDTLTDNKNRTVSEIRHLISKYGGSMGEAGCVAWMFEKQGYILVEKKTTSEDSLMAAALDARALDMKNNPEEENFEVITSPDDLNDVKAAIEQAGISVSLAEVTMIPKSYVKLEGKAAEQMTRLMDSLEDHEDVQNVYANFDIPDDILSRDRAA